MQHINSISATQPKDLTNFPAIRARPSFLVWRIIHPSASLWKCNAKLIWSLSKFNPPPLEKNRLFCNNEFQVIATIFCHPSPTTHVSVCLPFCVLFSRCKEFFNVSDRWKFSELILLGIVQSKISSNKSFGGLQLRNLFKSKLQGEWDQKKKRRKNERTTLKFIPRRIKLLTSLRHECLVLQQSHHLPQGSSESSFPEMGFSSKGKEDDISGDPWNANIG